MVSKATTQTGVKRQIERRNREKSELARAREAAGMNNISGVHNKRVNADWQKQVALMPTDDPRSLTGRLLGDPIPDPRAPWRGGASA